MLKKSSTTIEDISTLKKHTSLFIFILILMSMAGLVGSDVYLPVLPQMGMYLKQPPHVMQMTLAIYLLGLSLGQLILGPLTDRYGRKKLLVVGMLMYCVASFCCAFSQDIFQMLLFRFLQALSACTGLIIGRAIVGDLYNAKDAGRIFSTIFPFVGMSPAISPALGGMLGYYFGWQSTFIFIGIFASAIALLVIKFLPETLSIVNRRELSFINVISSYPKLLMDKQFIAYAAAPCTAYIAYFAYIAESPFIFHAHGFGERAIGLFYIGISATYVIGNLIGRHLVKTISLGNLLKVGFILFTVGGLLLLLSIRLNMPLYLMVCAASVLTLGNGFLIPLGTAGVVSTFSKSIGYASGLLGFLQLGSAALSASFIGYFSKHSLVYFGVYIFASTIVGMILFLMCDRKGK